MNLLTEEEISGLLNEAIFALGELIRDSEFDYTNDIETVRKIYEENSNTMTRFANERCIRLVKRMTTYSRRV